MSTKSLLSPFLPLLVLISTGCPNGTGWVIHTSDDDDSAVGDDDDTVGDDDDLTPTDDDDTQPDDDDVVIDDDDTQPDDDDFVPGTCEPAGVIDCGASAQQSGNNFPPAATSNVLTYSCGDTQWTGPEYTYTFVAPESGEYTIDLGGFQGDLELFLLEGDGVCDSDRCLDLSVNPPNQPESITFAADAGETFYVVVDGHQGATSNYEIALTCPSTGDDDDATSADDDDTVVDDDDTVLPDCPVFFVKGTSSRDFEMWTWNGAGFDGPQTFNPDGQGTAWGAVAGDFDGDGDLDAISNRGNGYAAQLWSSNCDGTFDETAITPSGFTFPSGAEDVHGAADLDGDGDIDVYGWDYFGGDGVVWLNGGDGQSWTTVDDAFSLDSWDPNNDGTHESVALGSYDLTADGIPDLLECSNNASSPTSCTVHAGTGNGTFTAIPGTSLAEVVNGVLAGDFTGDGLTDLVGGFDDDGDPGQVWIWQTTSVSPSPFSGPGTEVFDVNPGDESGNDEPGYGWGFPWDWDGDGDLDVVATVLTSFNDSEMTLWYVENIGGVDWGGWAAPMVIGTSDSATGGDNIIQTSMGMPLFN